MLLASPLVWTHYLPLVYWPLALLADRAQRNRQRGGEARRVPVAALAIWGLGAALLLAPVRAAGAQLFSVIALWLALMHLIVRYPPEPTPPTPHLMR